MKVVLLALIGGLIIAGGCAYTIPDWKAYYGGPAVTEVSRDTTMVGDTMVVTTVEKTVVREPQPAVERHYYYYFDVGPRPWWYDPYGYWYPFRLYRSGFYFSIGVWDWDPWWDSYWWDVYHPYWYYGCWYWPWSPYWYPYHYAGWYYYPYSYWPYGEGSYWVPVRSGVEPMERRPFERRRGLAREQGDSEDWVMSKRPVSPARAPRLKQTSSEERRIKKASESEIRRGREEIKGRTVTSEAPARRIKKETRTDERFKETSPAEMRRRSTEAERKPTTERGTDDKKPSETRRIRTVPTPKKEEPPGPNTKTRKLEKSPEMKIVTPRRIRHSPPVVRTPSRSITIRKPAKISKAPASTISTKSTTSSSPPQRTSAESSSKSSRRQRR
ncbi:MAG: hypothetical protein QMC93_01235 [Patescibacteria group bacterium]|nr:hypothetical protein [Patescibacteria group bacterium]